MTGPLHRDRVTPIPKPGKRKKAKKKPLSKRSKRKMDDGRKDLENECMGLWRKIVSYGKNQCEWCSKSKNVYQAHHIVTKKSSSALKYDPDNGIFLCQGCHFQAHNAGYMDFSLWFEKRFPGRYDRLQLKKHNKFSNSKSNLEMCKIMLGKIYRELRDL